MQDPAAAQVAEMLDQKGPASDEFRVERTIRCRPQLDVELERDAFVFDPPAA